MKTYKLTSDGVLKSYDYLSRMTRDRWAWEYMRRNPDYIQDAANHVRRRHIGDDSLPFHQSLQI